MNHDLVDCVDDKFLAYKPFTKGLLSAQLLYRLSSPQAKERDGSGASAPADFWAILGIEDEFDKSYIISQIKRFSTLYNVREPCLDYVNSFVTNHFGGNAASVAAGIVEFPPGNLFHLPPGSWPLMDGVAAGTRVIMFWISHNVDSFQTDS